MALKKLFADGAFFAVLFVSAGLVAGAQVAPQGTAQENQQSSSSQEAVPQAPTAAAPPQMSVQTRLRLRREQRAAALKEETYGRKYEVYGGGGYLYFRPGYKNFSGGPPLEYLNEVSWNGGITNWFNPKLGVTADFRGQYGTAYTPCHGDFEPTSCGAGWAPGAGSACTS